MEHKSNNILVDSKYWKESISINIGYGETKEYCVIAYPLPDYPDYICKIPSEYVVKKNNKPTVIAVWDEFIFEFEKEKKEPGKKFKRLKLTFDEVKELYKQMLDDMQYCVLAFCYYHYDRRRRKAVYESSEIQIGKTDGTWFYNIDNPQSRKLLKAKNSKIIKYSYEEEYLEYKRCLNEIELCKEKINNLKDYLQSNENQIKSFYDWHINPYKENKQITDEILKRYKGISNYLRKEIEKIMNSPEYDDNQCRLFQLIYSVDVKPLLGSSAKLDIELVEDPKIYQVDGYDFPYIILNKNNRKKKKYLYHQLVFLER